MTILLLIFLRFYVDDAVVVCVMTYSIVVSIVSVNLLGLQSLKGYVCQITDAVKALRV